MKILFLDFDGVLNVIPEGYDEFGAIFHKHFIDNLDILIKSTSSKIVITSTWKKDGIEKLKKMWEKRKYPCEIIDVIPHENLLVKKGLFKYNDDVKRGDEIQYWLNEHPEVTNYVIIDDDDDMLDNQMKHLVRTYKNMDHTDYVDIGYGLTKECTEKAIKILNE